MKLEARRAHPTTLNPDPWLRRLWEEADLLAQPEGPEDPEGSDDRRSVNTGQMGNDAGTSTSTQ
jgi:hypothetical protein